MKGQICYTQNTGSPLISTALVLEGIQKHTQELIPLMFVQCSRVRLAGHATFATSRHAALPGRRSAERCLLAFAPCRGHRSMPSAKQSLTRSGAVSPRSLTCTTEPSPSTSSPIACRGTPHTSLQFAPCFAWLHASPPGQPTLAGMNRNNNLLLGTSRTHACCASDPVAASCTDTVLGPRAAAHASATREVTLPGCG